MTQVTLAYVPVVHQGTLDFYTKYPGKIYILENQKSAEEYVYFERDMRALPAHEVAKALQAHGFTDVSVIAPSELAVLGADGTTVVSPQDEAIEFFVQKYAPDLSIQYVPAFLRWTKIISTQEFVVPPHRVLTHDAFAQEVILTLHGEEEKSSDWWRQVAAAIVKDGKVVFADHNRHLPSAHAPYINGDPRANLDAGQYPGIYTSIHAEAALIARAAREGVPLKGAHVYVTTFPCAGCARLLLEAGVTRVYYDKGYSTLDAEDILTGAGIEIVKVEMEKKV